MKFNNWNPTKDFYDLTNFVRDIFDDEVKKRTEWSNTRRFPVDIYEKNNEIFLEAEMPGVKKEDIEITLENGYLTVKTSIFNKKKEEKTEQKEQVEENRNYYFTERVHSDYSRTFEIGEGVSEEGIKAEFESGVLRLTFQKPEIKKEEVKKIKID